MINKGYTELKIKEQFEDLVEEEIQMQETEAKTFEKEA